MTSTVKNRKLSQQSLKRSTCPVACALDVLGDKWTLLVVRDLMFGKRRYSEFQDSAEGIPSNILAERLRRLQQAGLLTRTAYRKNPPRYEYTLTDSGQALGPVLKSIVNWSQEQIRGTRLPR